MGIFDTSLILIDKHLEEISDVKFLALYNNIETNKGPLAKEFLSEIKDLTSSDITLIESNKTINIT